MSCLQFFPGHVPLPPWSALSGSFFGFSFADLVGVFFGKSAVILSVTFVFGSAVERVVCKGPCMGSPTGDGVCWASSRMEFGKSGAGRMGSPTRGKQSQQCHHSNRIAAIGLTICVKICAFPVLLGHLGSVERLHYKIVVHGHHYDSGAKIRSSSGIIASITIIIIVIS